MKVMLRRPAIENTLKSNLDSKFGRPIGEPHTLDLEESSPKIKKPKRTERIGADVGESPKAPTLKDHRKGPRTSL